MDDFAHSHLELDDAKNPFDLKVLVLYAVARFRGLIIALGILGALLGLLAGAAQPNVYASVTQLKFEPSVRQKLRDDSAFGVDVGDVRVNGRDAMNEELELLRDPSIYDRVVEKLGAKEILRVADPRSSDSESTPLPVRFMHSLQAGLINLKGSNASGTGGETAEERDAAYDTLKAKLTIKNTRNTGLIVIKYLDSSPAKAKKVLDAIVQEMRMKHIEVFSAKGNLDILEENLEVALDVLKDTKGKLIAFKEECGFHDLDNDLALANAEIQERDRSLSDMNARRGALLGKIKSLKDDLGITVTEKQIEQAKKDAGSGEMPEGKQVNSVYLDLVTQLKSMEKELSLLRINFTKKQLAEKNTFPWRNQRDYLERIARIESTLEVTDLYVDEENTVLGAELNDSFAETRTLLIEARGDLEGLINEIEESKERIQVLKDRRRSMEQCEAEYDRLKSQTELADLKVKALSTQERQLSGLAFMEEDPEQRSELTVFRKSRLVKDKEGPQRSKPLLMGLIGGMALGAGLAVLRQLLDRKVRYTETIENTMGLRVLCVIPDLSSKEGFRSAKGAA